MADYVCEEINDYCEDVDDEDDSESASDSDTDTLDRQISQSKGYSIPISEDTANDLYGFAGSEEKEENNNLTVLPSPHILSTYEEQLVSSTKKDLNITFDIDNFQLQAIMALRNGRNTVLLAPCGAGKLIVFYMAVHILRIEKKMPNGVGLCLQPLNNILCEKTNSDPPIKTAYLTMTGECVKSGNALLTHPVDEILSGQIGCLLGHAESFLSPTGTTSLDTYSNIKKAS